MASSSKPDAASRSKVVIRRLPPTLPEETFWTSVGSWVSENTCLWKRYVRGKAAETNEGHAIFSRAYVLLNSTEAVAEFHKGYDGHVFRSKAGDEFQAVVELAPIQKTSYQLKAKADARQGTIDTEPDYMSYLESLKSPPEKPVLEVSGPVAQPTTTPLLEHLRTHGRSKGKRGKDKATSTSSTDVAARRALASVNAAAAKRAPNAASGPILVAGKGREVTVASSDTANTASAAPGEGKKKRNRGKGKGAGGGNSTSAESGNTASAQSPAAIPASSGAKTPRQTKAEKAASAPAAGGAPTAKTDGPGPEGGKAGRGGKGGRGGGGGGRGKGEGKERSAKGAVNAILTKNAEGEPARGGGGAGRGRGRGRGGGTGPGATSSASVITPATSMARIDG